MLLNFSFRISVFQEVVCSSFFSLFSSPECQLQCLGITAKDPADAFSCHSKKQPSMPPHIWESVLQSKTGGRTFCLQSSSGMPCCFYCPGPRMTKILCVYFGVGKSRYYCEQQLTGCSDKTPRAAAVTQTAITFNMRLCCQDRLIETLNKSFKKLCFRDNVE